MEGETHEQQNSKINFGQTRIDPLLLASRIGDLWNQRKMNPHSPPLTTGIQPPVPTNENKIMLSQVSTMKQSPQIFSEGRWNPQNDFLSFNHSNFLAPMKSEQIGEQRNSNDSQFYQWNQCYSNNEDNSRLLAYKRREAKVYLDKARREWKVEWTEDNNVKMKRFSCKRWGKAKAKASAMEYYMLVLRGMPLHPNRPFFSQIRKLMDRKEQALKQRPISETNIEDPKKITNALDRRSDELGWFPPQVCRNMNKKNPLEDDADGSINLAWVCGNRTVDALCSAMNVSLGRNPADEGIIPYYPNSYL